MSYLFQTDNVFYVPEGGVFRIFDIAEWRAVEIDVQSLAVRLLSDRLPEARAFAARALERAAADNEDLDELEEAQAIDGFLETIPLTDHPTEASSLLTGHFPRQAPTIWVRVSQKPLESFFTEDYEVQGGDEATGEPAFSAIGSIAFNAFTDQTFDLPSEDPRSFHLIAQKDDWIRERPLGADEPLPLLREYCGLNGSSAQGDLVTLDLQGRIPDASLAAVPIRRQGEQRFETLYMHLPNPVGEGMIRVFRPDEEGAVASILKREGFEAARRTRRFACFRRNDDVLQVYRNLPGKESERVPVLPPFAMFTQVDGHRDPMARRIRLESLFGKPKNLTD